MASDRFRWVFCQLEVLRQCFPSRVRSVLAELPESLDDTYERILLQIPKSNRVYAHRLLQCLVVAVRPLSVEELAEVLAIDFSAEGGTPMADEKLRWEDKEQAVLLACSTLIAVVDDAFDDVVDDAFGRRDVVDDWSSRRVQFSHFSVKEFLTSDRLAASTMDDLRYHHIRLVSAHTIMAQACLGVLLRLDNTMDKQTIKSYPLARYSGKHFGDHVEFENVLSHVTDGVDDLLDPDKPHFEPWLWLQIGDWVPHLWHTASKIFHSPPRTPAIPVYPPRVVPLYYVVAFGPLCLAHRLILKHPEDLHVRDNKGYIPLQIAVLAGKEAISQLLIEYSADLDIQDIEGRTLLHMAAYKGLFKVAQMLLQHDGVVKMHVNARNKNGQTALHLASEYHYPRIVALLLKVGLDVDAQDNDDMTPLLLASGLDTSHDARCTASARVLLEDGGSIGVQHKNRQTLHIASQHHLSGGVTLLLKSGPDADERDHDNMRTFYFPAPRRFTFNYSDPRSTAAAQVLLEHGASVHVRNKNGQTPLHLASQCHHSSIVALLLKFGADVDAHNNDNLTPLLLASGQYTLDNASGTGAAQVLLEHGASVHVQNKNGQTPLHLASEHHLPGVAVLLLKLGLDVDAQDNDSMTPLLLAASGRFTFDYAGTRSTAVAQVLLEHGASVHVRNKNGQTPLHLASQRHLSGMVALLLKSGLDLDAQDNDNMTPLLLAASGRFTFNYSDARSTAAAQVLLEHGASVHVRNKNGQTPLHLASQHGFSGMVALLLKFGADMNVQDDDNMTPLHFAVHLSSGPENGFFGFNDDGDTYYDKAVKIITLLLEHGVNVQVQNNNGETPLRVVLGRGDQNSEVIRLLSEHMQND
jgi:ankyrin repeat protein